MENKTIDCTKVLATYGGEAFKDGTDDLTVGRAISNILSRSQEGGKYKLFILGKKFYEENEVSIDKADFELVKKTIDGDKSYLPIVTGQLLSIISEVEPK